LSPPKETFQFLIFSRVVATLFRPFIYRIFNRRRDILSLLLRKSYEKLKLFLEDAEKGRPGTSSAAMHDQ
jgi:hypothetical protein